MLRNAAARVAMYSLEKAKKKVIIEPEEFSAGNHFPNVNISFSFNGDDTIASLDGKVHQVAINERTVERVMSIKARSFTALIVWRDFVDERQRPVRLA